ncbi:MAG: HAD-IIIA family hydrolase [Candidatus Marinimicrobia bacterium]|nr:HAD-IIIA family hydrolase [Candidatus Neomarinimicrobiota bacterium]
MPAVKHKQKAVFFDRDGVINHLVKRDSSYYSPQKFEDFKIVNDAKEVVNHVHEMGYLAIIISNQPDISRGKLAQSELDKMTDMLYKELNIDDVFYCIHDDDNDTGCRKPAPGLFYTAQKKDNIDLNKSFMIGDTWKDVEAAKNAGISMILIRKDYNKELVVENDVQNLSEAVSFINKS